MTRIELTDAEWDVVIHALQAAFMKARTEQDEQDFIAVLYAIARQLSKPMEPRA